MGMTEEQTEQGIEKLFEEIMTKHFPNWVKEKDTQIQKAQRGPNKFNTRRSMPRHIIIQTTRLKEEEKNPKSCKRKASSYL